MPRRDFSKVAFAATGDTNVIPSTTQPDGSVSLPQGWGFDYQRDNGAGGGTPDPLAKNIDREDMNGILNEITASIGEIQQYGLPIWVATAAPYPINAEVRHVDKIWRSSVTNNSTTPGAVGATWTDVTLTTPGRFLKVTTFAASGTWTPDPLATKYRLRMVGGGGAGAGAPGTSAGSISVGGGGGAGVGLETKLLAVPLSSVAITIGAGGTPTNGGAGNPGQATVFGSLFSVDGGFGGQPAGPAPTFPFHAFPGAATGSVTGNSADMAYIFRGQAGSYGLALNINYYLAGTGAQSMFAGGGYAQAATAGNTGGVGAGGSGGARGSATAASVFGGAGGAGLAVIEEYT